MVANRLEPLLEQSYTRLLQELDIILYRAKNTEWVFRRECYLRNKLREGLNHRKTFYCLAVEGLLAVLPTLRGHARYFHWTFVVNDALNHIDELGDERKIAQVQLELGELMLGEGQHEMARIAASFAQAKVAETPYLDIQLLCLIFLLRTQPLREFQDDRKQIIYQSLQLAKRLRDDRPDIRAKLFLTLASYYSFRHKFRASEHYARHAFRIFARIGDVRGKIECLVIQANNAAYHRQQTRAERILKRLENHVRSNETLLYHAYFLYGRAGMALYQDDIERAISDYGEARVKFNQMQALPMVAICDHALALAYAASGRNRQARQHLGKARRIWRRLKAVYRLVDIQVAHCYVARQEGNLPKAMCLLAQASEDAREVTNPDLRRHLTSSIEAEAAIVVSLWNSRHSQSA